MSTGCASTLERRPTTGRPASTQSACACHDRPTVEAGVPRFLGLGGFQGKLEIGAIDDPLEQEADAFAQAVSHDETALPRFLGRDRPSAARRLCDDCAQETIGELADAPAPATVQRESLKTDPPVDGDGEGGAGHGDSGAGRGDGGDEPGKPLPPSVRPRLESSLGLDLGAVRVHADGTAAKAARSLGAKAFTHGNDIWLGSGQSADDLHLMAHEVAHVIQQRDFANPPVRRALDPANPMAWAWFSPEHRRSEFRSIFDETLGAASERSLTLEEGLSRGEGVPTDEESRARLDAAFTRRLETLVRLNALGLMASHRAGIELKRDQMLDPDRVPEVARDEGSDREQAMASLRNAAVALQHLNDTRSRLQESRSTLRGVSVGALHGDICLSLSDCMTSWLEDIYNATRFQETLTSARMNSARATTLRDGLPRDLMRVFFHVWANDMVEWRERQIGGVDAALTELYINFPLFKTLNADEVTDEPEMAGDEALARRAAEAYSELLDNVDEAIVKIGSGDIHPFDLPQAVSVTEAGLPTEVRAEFARIRHDRETTQFWTTMGLTLAQVAAVFIPVVGPAIAVGIGVASTAIDLENLMDRIDLAQASIDPEGEMLGAAAPGAFDYTMAALQVILTAADIGALAAELRGASRAALATPESAPDVEVGGAGRTASEPHPPIDETPPGRAAGTSASERARVLDETAVLEGPQLTPAQRAVEIEAVQRGEARPSTMPGYVDEVVLENGHTWRRRADGTWCRFSGGPSLCGTQIPGVPPGGATGHPPLPSFNRNHRARLRRLGDQLNAHGLSWEDIGLGSDADVATHFAGRSDIPEGIAELEARAARRIEEAGVHAELRLPGDRTAGVGDADNAGSGMRIDPENPTPEGHRIPRSDGAWDGEPGNSPWLSDNLEVYQITQGEPIPFINGEPSLVNWAEEGVILGNMTGIDAADFAAADRALMRQYPGRWPNQTAVERWRSSARLTWHHEPDLETMTLVPMALHGNLPHLGGASMARRGMRPERVPVLGTHPL